MSETLSGVVFGLVAGLTPGPLLVLVVRQTLCYGTREGLKVAGAPVLTDPLIIGLALVALNRVEDLDGVVGGACLLGSGFLTYLAYRSLTFAGFDHGHVVSLPRSIRNGMVVNLTNPHPYLFWWTVGVPIVWRAWAVSPVRVVGFLAGVYGCLVGSTMLVAWLVGRGKSVLDARSYEVVVRALGLILVIFVVQFFHTGLEYLGLC